MYMCRRMGRYALGISKRRMKQRRTEWKTVAAERFFDRVFG